MADDLADQPPSAKLVYYCLEQDSALTREEIANRTRLPKSTVHDALDQLEAANHITSQPHVKYPSQAHYCVTEQ